jgi:uncharacterized membrane protein
MSSQLVHTYLDHLRSEAAVLPPGRRAELLAEIQAHLAEARRAPGGDTDIAVLTLLDRLGSPEEIVAAAMAEEEAASGAVAADARQDRRGLPGRDLAAILLLPLGGFVFLVGWFAGVLLLWTSENWTTRHKVIGTLALPFGVVGSLYLGMAPGGRVCGGGSGVNLETVTWCGQR